MYLAELKSKRDISRDLCTKQETIIERLKLTQPSIEPLLFRISAEIPRVVQTQGTAGEESGEHEDDDDERGYDGRAGK